MQAPSKKQPPAKSHPLWTLLGPPKIAPLNSSLSTPSTKLKNPPLNPKDKASTSIRLVLSDVQSTVEGFSDRITKLTEENVLAQREIRDAGKIIEEAQEKGQHETKLSRAYVVSLLIRACKERVRRFFLLVGRMQASLQEAGKEAKDSSHALDVKMDISQATMTAKQDNMQQANIRIFPFLSRLTPHIANPKSHAAARSLLGTSEPIHGEARSDMPALRSG